jgi:DNA anti-recombination protein RmuC
MPVTAKLSKKFYDALGEDVANELVEWFNQVDLTYRTDLRELNELNFARFDAKLEQRIATLRADLAQRMAALEARLDRRLVEVRAELEQRIAALQARLDQRIVEIRAELHKETARLEARIEHGLAGQATRMEHAFAAHTAHFDAKLDRLRAELIKWMFLFWIGSVGLALLINRLA